MWRARRRPTDRGVQDGNAHRRYLQGEAVKVWTTDQFTGFWPVGTAAVVASDNPVTAAWHLNEALKARGLPGDAKPDDMKQFVMSSNNVLILCDGNY